MTNADGKRCLLFASFGSNPVLQMTGIGRYIEELVRGLADMNNSSGWHYEMCSPLERGQATWLPASVGRKRVPVSRRPLRLLWAAAARPSLERLAGEFDLVHALHASSPVPTHRKVVVTFHDLMPIVNPEWHTTLVSWSAKRALQWVAVGQGPVITDSKYVAGQLHEVGGIAYERITVIHLGVGDEFRHQVQPAVKKRICDRYGLEEGGFFIAVGRVGVRKNLPTLVRALAKTDPAGPPLVLAGIPYTGSDALDAEIAALGIANRVRKVGFVADEELPGLIQSSRALLHPAFDEGFGLPPLEAMAGGTPVAASNAGSLPEVVEDAGLLVSPTDDDEWAAAISKLAIDDDLCERLASNGPVQASRFTWRRVAEQTRDVYERALAG